MTETGGEQFSQGRIQCECNCNNMGGISAAGWVVISLFIGLAVGSVTGIFTALWFMKKREKEKRETEALSNWRIVGQPGTIAAAAHPMRPTPSQASVTEDFNFAPMSMHKHKLLSASPEFELQSLQASHMSNPFPLSKSPPGSTTPSSRYSRHGASADSDPQTTIIPINSPDGGREEEPSHGMADEESQQVGVNYSDVEAHSQNRLISNGSTRGTGSQVDSMDPVRLIRQYTRTSSGLDEEVLSSIHSLTSIQILGEYAMADLNDDWKEILGAIDRMLADQDERALDKRERAVAMKALLNASESDGVDLALEGALMEVLNERGSQGL